MARPAPIVRPEAPGFEWRYFVQLDADRIVVGAGESGLNTAVDAWDNHPENPDVVEVTDNPNVPDDDPMRPWYSLVTGSRLNADGTFTAPAPPPPTVAVDRFFDLFSQAERIDMRQRARGNDTTPPDDRIADLLQAVELKVGQPVNLESPKLLKGLQYLVSVGVLTVERAQQVRANTTPAE